MDVEVGQSQVGRIRKVGPIELPLAGGDRRGDGNRAVVSRAKERLVGWLVICGGNPSSNTVPNARPRLVDAVPYKLPPLSGTIPDRLGPAGVGQAVLSQGSDLEGIKQRQAAGRTELEQGSRAVQTAKLGEAIEDSIRPLRQAARVESIGVGAQSQSRLPLGAKK